MEIDKLKKVIYGNKNVSAQHLKQLSSKLTEETTNTSVINDLPKLIPAVFKYAVHEEKKFREAALPALTELAGLLDLNKHLKEMNWWIEMKAAILKSVDVLMDLVCAGDDQWAELWMTTVLMLGSDLRSELTLLNRLLKVVEKAFKMNDEEVRHQGFECWCKLIDNFSINNQEINNKRRLGLLVIPLKANNHNTPRLCSSKMKTWKHLLSKLDQHNEMTVQLLVTHFLEFMFRGVGSIAPACKILNMECANTFSQMLQTPLLFRILPELFIKHTFVCIEHTLKDETLCLTIWQGLLDNMKSNQWTENHVSELMINMTSASMSDKLGRSMTFAHMVRSLYCGNHSLPGSTLVKHLKTLVNLAMEPHVLVNYAEDWYNELLNIIAETDPIQLPQNIVGEVIAKLNVLATSELFRDGKLKFLRGMWMSMTNIISKWMADDGQIGKNGNAETDVQNIHQLLFFGAAPLSSTWNKLQMKSWKSLYSECVKFFSLSMEVKCGKFVGDLVQLLVEGVKDKKIPIHVALDLVSVVLEFHLSKDESSILPLMMEVALSTMSSFQRDSSGTFALLSQYLKIILVAARSEPALVSDILTVVNKMLTSLEDVPLADSHLEKARNLVMKAQIQINALKPCRSQDRLDSPGTNNNPPATSPTMTSFMHRLAKSKETKSKISSPTPSQSSDVSSSPVHTPNSKKSASPFRDLKSEDFVFVPPKPRKIFLTEHQKESLTTRKHDIPALYQDLSQDSSQSAFESIVTPVHAIDKEQKTEKGTLHSPQTFKDINFRSLSPRKSLAINLRSCTTEDKLQNNKENDCFNNNTKSPSKINTNESKSSGGIEEVPLKVLLEDKNKVQDNVSESEEVSKVTPTNTHMRLRKSSGNGLSGKPSINNSKEESNEDTNCNKHYEDEESPCNRVINTRSDQEKSNANSSSIEKKIKGSAQNVTTSKTANVAVKTPKTSLKKTKLNISIEKSVPKRNNLNKEEEEVTVSNESTLSSSNSVNKSPSSFSTPKVSPRRLRKRKSGITPVLSGGELNKRAKRKTPSPSILKEIPTNKSSLKNDTPVGTKSGKMCKSHSQIASSEGEEIIQTKQTEEAEEQNNSSNKPKLKSSTDHGPCASKSKTEKVNIMSDSACFEKEDIASRSIVNSTEKLNKVVSENEDEEIKILATVKNDNTKPRMETEKCELRMSDVLVIPSKNFVSLQKDVPCIDVSCSPAKVVVERLPNVILRCLENHDKRDYHGETIKEIDIVEKKATPVRNIISSLSAADQDRNSSSLEMSSNINKTISKEQKDESSQVTFRVGETNKEEKMNECKGNSNGIVIPNIKSSPTKVNSNKILAVEVHLQPTNLDSSSIRTRSSEKLKISSSFDNCDGETNSIPDVVDNIMTPEKTVGQNVTDIKSFPAEKMCISKLPSASASKITESHNSTSTTSKLKSIESSPVTSGQKQLKQTLLPFSPIRKTEVLTDDLNTKSEYSEKQTSAKLEKINGKSPLIVLTKMGSPEINKALQSPNSKNQNQITLKSNKSDVELKEEKAVEPKAGDGFLLTNNILETKQEVQRTPEKTNVLNNVEIHLQKTEIDVRVTSKNDSPIKTTDSEDIIASSQENDVTTQSILAFHRNSSTSNSLKLLSKSPKKCENVPQPITSCDRVLRSSPLKTENSRYSGTPIKKSVCRRLDVEIEESPESNEIECLINTSISLKSSEERSEEELSDDFKLLNGEIGSQKFAENHSLPSTSGLGTLKNLDDTHSDSGNHSPRPHRSSNKKRFVVESDASSVGSPKRTVGSLRIENNSSPISSPNSRTSQMMELAKQEAERTLSSSSPISSSKKRRILPTRIGPIRTPINQIIQRTHNGPSEEWVRRTYSPTASPNSSILKRTHYQTSQLVSPDSSPPSTKKKRVSFLDPPVSESLLFSKANPGKGQIQRPELKQDELMDQDSEEIQTQGSVSAEVPELPTSDTKVFSPLKQCSSPLTDIMERIVNMQWMSDLEAQLEGLGVTTVGQLSSLPEETVVRLPFIPPKLDRLRKILQNYYNEINEKPIATKSSCSQESTETCLSPDKDSARVETSLLKKTVEYSQSQSQETAGLEELSDREIAVVAENIKQKLEKHPELISELINKLNISLVMKILDVSVCKLKKEIDKS